MNQIGAGITKGYPEHDIVMAVFESISPELSIKGYREALQRVTLSKVKQTKRAHFKEMSSIDLYQSLVNMAQLPDEDPQEFLMGALNVRQRILINAEDEIIYNPTLVKGIFLRTLETGLKEDNIRTKLRPLLQSTSVDMQN